MWKLSAPRWREVNGVTRPCLIRCDVIIAKVLQVAEGQKPRRFNVVRQFSKPFRLACALNSVLLCWSVNVSVYEGGVSVSACPKIPSYILSRIWLRLCIQAGRSLTCAQGKKEMQKRAWTSIVDCGSKSGKHRENRSLEGASFISYDCVNRRGENNDLRMRERKLRFLEVFTSMQGFAATSLNMRDGFCLFTSLLPK